MRFYVSEVSGRNPRSSPTSFLLRRPLTCDTASEALCCFDYTFPERNLPAGGAGRGGFVIAVMFAGGMLASDVLDAAGAGQSKPVFASGSQGKKTTVAAGTENAGER